MKIKDVVTLEEVGSDLNDGKAFYDKIEIDEDFQKNGFIPFPNNAKITCSCGYEIDLSGIKSQLEMQTKRKIITA